MPEPRKVIFAGCCFWWGGVALLLAGCSADLALFRADSSWWSSGTAVPAPLGMRAAPPDALIGPDGACPEGAQPPRGVAPGMTECDLVRVAGATNQIELGTNERGERTAVLTYPQGERAGIYRFVSGLLVSIEGLPQAPGPPKRAKPTRTKKAPKPQVPG